MDLDRHPKFNKSVLFFVSGFAVLFLLAGGGLGIWSAREMRETVAEQFSQQQLVIARHVSVLLERQLAFLRRELLLFKKEGTPSLRQPEQCRDQIEDVFSRVLESGVYQIEIVEPSTRKEYVFGPSRRWALREVPGEKLRSLPDPAGMEAEDVWCSRPGLRASGNGFTLAAALPGDPSRLLLFQINTSWFLAPFLRDIRSGKTGYAWLIDDGGHFLYHPNSDFVGKDAFKVRADKFPAIDPTSIFYIQREEMLKGRTGTGSYHGGWHRGLTGRIKKLIAFSPVHGSEKPEILWSVAVVAPTSEIEDSAQQAYLRLFFLQGLVIVVIFVSAGALLFFERRWSKVLERKVERRTEDLQKSEEKYRSLVESAEDFIFTVDPRGVFLSMNSFTANFFGGRPEAFIGKTLSALFAEETAAKQFGLVSQVYKAGKSVRDEFEVQVGDHTIWLSANFMPLKNEEGSVAAVLCIARDVTENKILERQLINAEKLASMGTLAAGVAHEVNNPLGVILGFCDLLLRKTEKGSQAHEDLKTIERQGLHCKQVVENLLSFARLGEGESEDADLNECAQDIIKVVRHTLEMHDVELSLSLSDDMPRVRGNPRQIQQVFLNLMNNAIAAMPGGGRLGISTFCERTTGRGVIQFRDNGVGIREEDKDRIFEPFFTTKPEGQGTGLGLFVSYGIIAKYGGTIDFVSHRAPANPSGTTFTIKLIAEGQ